MIKPVLPRGLLAAGASLTRFELSRAINKPTPSPFRGRKSARGPSCFTSDNRATGARPSPDPLPCIYRCIDFFLSFHSPRLAAVVRCYEVAYSCQPQARQVSHQRRERRFCSHSLSLWQNFTRFYFSFYSLRFHSSPYLSLLVFRCFTSH